MICSESMKNSFVSHTIFEHCDASFAQGFNSFVDELFSSFPRISHTFLSRKYSMQSLLAKYLDQSFEVVLNDFYGASHREALDGYRVSGMSSYFSSRKDLTRYQQVYYSLEFWSSRLHQFAREEDARLNPVISLEQIEAEGNLLPSSSNGVECKLTNRQKRFYATLDTLLVLIENLKAFKPMTSEIPTLPDSLIDKSKTTQYNPSQYSYHFCKLCWKPIQRVQANKDVNFRDVSKTSNKFCDDHALNGQAQNSPNWARYIKSRRYLEEFNKQLENLCLSSLNEDRFKYLIEIRDLRIFIGLTISSEFFRIKCFSNSLADEGH